MFYDVKVIKELLQTKIFLEFFAYFNDFVKLCKKDSYMSNESLKRIPLPLFLSRIAQLGKNSYDVLGFLVNGADKNGVLQSFVEAKELYASTNSITYFAVQRHIAKLESLELIKKISGDRCIFQPTYLDCMIPNRVVQYCNKCKTTEPHHDDEKKHLLICTSCGNSHKYKVQKND